MRMPQRWGRLVHALRGSRSLLASGSLALLATLTQGAVPNAWMPWMTAASLGLLLLGLTTLAREGSAAQAALPDAAPGPHLDEGLVRLLGLPLLLVLLLLPRFFLAAYGIPHLSPLTGLIVPALQARISLVLLAAVLLVPILALRRARHALGDPAVLAPADIPDDDPRHGARLALFVATGVIVVVWLVLLRSFWSPFSLLAWPPGFSSLGNSRGVTALAFALAPPVTLFTLASLHTELARLALALPTGPARNRQLALAIANLALVLSAAALHTYDLLWIARYQASSNI